MSRLEKKFFALTYYLAFSGFNIIAVTSQDISQLVQPLLVTVIIKLTFFYNLTRSLITFTATAMLQRIEQEGVLGKSILTGLVTDHQLSGKESFLIAVLTVIIYFAFRVNSYGIPAAAVLTYTYTIIACGLIGNIHSILMRKSL